jgi:ubiquinone/menaquinone biosynthesis C-methylase UbiE
MNIRLSVSPIFKKISDKPLVRILPSYVWDENILYADYLQYYGARFLLSIFKIFIRIRLHAISIESHKKQDLYLTQKVVDMIYTREAHNYEQKHHRTTHHRDTWWRRLAGFHIVSIARKKKLQSIRLLDIGTGIGLSLEEMFRIFKEFDVAVQAIGLDYNQAMLQQAIHIILPRMEREQLINHQKQSISFIRGDAARLTDFKDNSFDFITLVCGMGGIHTPPEAFKEELRVLKPGGSLIVIDIHRPLFHLSSHWPWYTRIIREDLFQYLGWRYITRPLALRDLWGWLDPTPLFYILPFTAEEKTDAGFTCTYFDVETERWWFGLPVMTTAKIILEKEYVSGETAKERTEFQQELLSSIIEM